MTLWKKISLSSALSYISHDCFFFFIMISFLYDKGLPGSQVLLCLATQRFVKFALEIPCGFLFDRLGGKKLFLASKVIKIISIFLIFHQSNLQVLLFSFAILGTSQAMMLSKIETFIYNNLDATGQILFFKKAVSLFYIIEDIAYTLMPIATILIYRTFGYQCIFFASIAMSILSIVSIAVSPSAALSFSGRSSYKIFKDIIFQGNNGSRNTSLLPLIFQLAMLNGVVWQFFSEIITIFIKADLNFNTNMILFFSKYINFYKLDQDANLTNSVILFLSFIVNIFMAIGSIFSFITKSYRGVSVLIFLVICTLLAVGFSVYLKNYLLIIVFSAFLMFIYTAIEVKIAEKLEVALPKEVRGVFFSIVCCVGTGYQALNLCLLSCISSYLPLSDAIFILFIISCLFFLITLLPEVLIKSRIQQD